MRDILGSYRWRRRLTWAGGSLLLAVAALVLIVLLPKASGDELGGVKGPLAPVVGDTRRQTPVSAADRASVNRTLRAFISTAVTRDDPAAAWSLVTPAMRAGVTRAEWNRGDLPVVPYPVVVPKKLEWTVVTSYPRELTLDLVLQPRRGSGRGAASFFVELERARTGPWLIDSMYAEDVFAVAPANPEKNAAEREAAAADPDEPLSPLWIALPLGLLGLVFAVPVAIVLVTWRRQRSIDRRYRAMSQRRP